MVQVVQYGSCSVPMYVIKVIVGLLKKIDDLFIHCDYLLEALETDEFNVCRLFKIIFDGLNPNIMNLVDTCYRLYQSITSL